MLSGRKELGAKSVSDVKSYRQLPVLCNANLDELSRVLRSPAVARIEAKGTQSVRSPVANLGLLQNDVFSVVGEHIAPGVAMEQMRAEDVDGATVGREESSSYE